MRTLPGAPFHYTILLPEHIVVVLTASFLLLVSLSIMLLNVEVAHHQQYIMVKCEVPYAWSISVSLYSKY